MPFVYAEAETWQEVQAGEEPPLNLDTSEPTSTSVMPDVTQQVSRPKTELGAAADPVHAPVESSSVLHMEMTLIHGS